MTALAPTLQAFFTDRLTRQKDASPHTIAAYRDALRLLLGFAWQRTCPTDPLRTARDVNVYNATWRITVHILPDKPPDCRHRRSPSHSSDTAGEQVREAIPTWRAGEATSMDPHRSTRWHHFGRERQFIVLLTHEV